MPAWVSASVCPYAVQAALRCRLAAPGDAVGSSTPGRGVVQRGGGEISVLPASRLSYLY